MHDHSRFQRDIDDVTGVSLSLSLLLTKVTHAQYRKRFRASYNMANSSTPHLWAHVRQSFLKSLMFYIFFGWCRCDGAMSSHKTLVKTFAFGPKHCMMTGGNQLTMA